MKIREHVARWALLSLAPLRRIFVPRARAAIIVVGLGVPLLAAVAGSRLLTDYLWFREVGQGGVFLRMLALKAGLVAGAGAVASIWLLAAVGTAVRLSPVRVTRGPAVAGAAGCIVAGFAVGLRAKAHWMTVDLWLHRSAFGAADPVHHEDVGGFVFTLPVLEASATIALAVMSIGILAAAAVYTVSGALSLAPLRVTPAAGMHLAVLGALALAGMAFRSFLLTYSLEVTRVGTPGVPAFPGADYADVRVRIPALQLIAILTLLCAGALVLGAGLAASGHGRAGAQVAGWPVLATACAVPVLLLLIPWAVQQFVVAPQPLARERPQLQAAIGSTRRAFSLTRVSVVRVAAPAPIPRSALAASGPLADVQVWDGSILLQWLRQLESGTPYFRASSPTLEVRQADGEKRPVVFAERELDPQWIPGRAERWADRAVVFTHGRGSFSVSAAAIRASGEPQLLRAAPLSRPQIYFGRQPPAAASWVVADTRRLEADGLEADGQPRPDHYRARGGVALSSWIRRAAFAIRLAAPPLLLSSDITPRSRIILHRDVIDRLTALAGFIRWDPATTAAVSGGHVVFVAAGYATSTDYPEAEPVRLAGRWVNYARASVVATVDAYSGQTRLYLADHTDPIARAWAAAFPSLFRPITEFPPGLRGQLRYPPALFDAQAGLYEQFHAQDPAGFASGADIWGYPTSLSGPISAAGNIRFGSVPQLRGTALRPAYRLATPPGGHATVSLLRTALYTPASGQNVVAELDGWIGDRGNLRLAAVEFPGNRLIPGPAQVSRLVFTAPRIVSALRVINRETTDLGEHSLAATMIGRPAWLRLAGGVVQVQPVYLEAGGSGIARMLGVTVYVNGHSGIGRTLTEAIRQATSPP